MSFYSMVFLQVRGVLLYTKVCFRGFMPKTTKNHLNLINLDLTYIFTFSGTCWFVKNFLFQYL